MEPFKKGAEADLYLENWHGRKTIVKKRIQKRYRNPVLDLRLRISRTIREAENLHEAKKAAVPTPIVYMIDKENTALFMEYIEGARIKEILDRLSIKERSKVCIQIGNMIGCLHNYSLIHGDLTTSNMIISDQQKIFLIDFGLSFHSQHIEDKGVDLHLMKRALNSTHYENARESMKKIMQGYQKAVGSDATLKVLKKIKEIEYRGRYFNERT